MYTHTDTPLPLRQTKELEKDYLTLFDTLSHGVVHHVRWPGYVVYYIVYSIMYLRLT